MLTNPYLVAVGIPLLLMLCGALAKKLVRGGGWKLTDFFLGVELSLASLGSAMVYFYDLQKLPMPGQPAVAGLGDKIGATATFLAISFFLLLWVLSTHQDWETRTTNKKGQVLMLGLLSNGVGIALFAGFVLLVKGV
jgi:hypothetical protein